MENERSLQGTESVTESFNFRNTSAKVTEVMTDFYNTKEQEVATKQHGVS